MKKPFYSWGAKFLVILVMLVSITISACCGAWFLVGAANGVDNFSTLIHPVKYEKSPEAGEYLWSESDYMIHILSSRYHFCKDGVFDKNATVDISSWKEGVLKKKKQPELEYRLGDLIKFRESVEYWRLRYLVDCGGEYVLSDYWVEEDAPEEFQDPSTEGYAISSDNTVLGPDAKAIDSVNVNIDDMYEAEAESDNLNLSLDSRWTVSYYSTLFNVLYNNGIALEKSAILTANKTTLADYALEHPKDISLLDCYKALLDVTDSVYSLEAYLDGSELHNTNAMVYVRDTVSGRILTNIDRWQKLSSMEEVKADYTSGKKASAWISSTADERIEFSDNSLRAEESWTQIIRYIQDTCIREFPDSSGKMEIFCAMDGTYAVNDIAKNYSEFFSWYTENTPWNNILPLFFIGLAGAVAMIVLSVLQTGRRAEDPEKIYTAPIDRFPIELLILLDIVLWVVLLACLFTWVDFIGMLPRSNSAGYVDTVIKQLPVYFGLAVCAACGTIILFTWNLKHYIRRIKARTIGGSLIKNLVRVLAGLGRNFYDSRKEHSKLILLYVLFAIVQAFLAGLCGILLSSNAEIGAVIIFILTVCLDIFVLYTILRSTRGREETKRGMEEIAGGNLEYKIDVEQTYGYTRTIAEGINGIGEGLKNALDAEMRSERMKADLITNVSHDIKTPLTSIINYVDLLKREHITEEPIAGYIEVLDRKSERLKQLVNDLVESSKISSGTIKLEKHILDLRQLILQANVEFEDKFAARELQLVAKLPETPLRINADGARIYRVIENLYNNVSKYAMPHSRVYIEAGEQHGRVVYSIKNISEYPLNIDADELMERFVRGDLSRSTEGSGLGLEIARNLTTMHNGTFDIQLDGDLFKVILTFPKAASVQADQKNDSDQKSE